MVFRVAGYFGAPAKIESSFTHNCRKHTFGFIPRQLDELPFTQNCRKRLATVSAFLRGLLSTAISHGRAGLIDPARGLRAAPFFRSPQLSRFPPSW